MRDDYGVWMAFCRSFISPENEEAFLRISKEFLQNEPLIKENGLFKDIPLPYEDGTTVYSLYTQTLLGMMLACAEKKSSYAEDSSITEKLITYDLKFTVKNPRLSSDKLLVALHIDLEFQNKYRPTLKDGRSYPLIKRGIYYAARDISSQLGRITLQTNYDDIEKVVSIWIVNEDIPEKLQNTATRYYLSREDFIGTAVEPEADYDLMEVIMIRRGDAKDITEPLFKYLESVYKADIKEIEAYTPVSGNPELKKEVESMPGMSQVIYNNGLAEGVLQGISQGITQGIEQGQNLLVETVQRLRNGESREEIIASGVDEHTVDLAMTIR